MCIFGDFGGHFGINLNLFVMIANIMLLFSYDSASGLMKLSVVVC